MHMNRYVDAAVRTAGPMARYIVPEFRERTSNGERVHNPYTKLFEERIIFLGVQIDDASADDVMAQLLCHVMSERQMRLSIAWCGRGHCQTRPTIRWGRSHS